MRIDLELELHRRARVWIGELPRAPDASMTKRLSLDCTGDRGVACFYAVEIAVPRGGMISYGLLGLHYEPMEATLEFSVGVGTAGPYGDSLVAGDSVHWGLDAEYAEAVLDQAASVAVTSGLPCGGFAFGPAACCVVGSSPRVFGELSKVLLSAAAAVPRPADVKSWREILEAANW